MRISRLSIEWVVLLAAALLGALWLQSSGATHRIDNQLLDKISPLARAPIANDIVLVAIDDASLDEIGPWPWPRSRHAELIERLDQAGARAIVYDVLFIEQTDPREDAALIAAMRAHGNIALPHSFIDRPNAQSGLDRQLPHRAIAEAAGALGHVVVESDDDGILRRFQLAFETDRGRYPHVAAQTMRLLGEELPRAAGDALVPFHPAASFPREPARDILDGSFLPQLYQDKIVLVGATAGGMDDLHPVAAGEVTLMSGVEAQANLLNALREDALITEVGAAWQNALAASALIALFAAFWFLSPRMGLHVALGLIAVLLAATIALLALGRLWLPVAPAILVILFAYPLWSWRRLSHVSRYLDREAARMRGERPARALGGMEYLAAQVERVRGLIHAIRDRLSFLRQVIEAAPDALIVIDEDGSVAMLNARAEALFAGWEKLGATTLDALFAFAGAEIQRDGGELLTADGRTYLVARAPVADEGDAFSGEILALRDISAIRRLDHERTQMLEFLSHDMRNPQVAIIGLTQLAGKAIQSGDTLTRIRKQADRTLKLADDFVQLARLEDPQLQIEDCDLGALVEEACDRAYGLARVRQITLEQDLPSEPCFADVDPSLIARMLDNLIGNAIKFSPEGSRIELTLDSDEQGHARIAVADHGIGLSEARLAQPFARFGAHATDAGPSAGLGLALMKKVVDAHRGTIAVASRKGEGTRFTITLPG